MNNILKKKQNYFISYESIFLDLILFNGRKYFFFVGFNWKKKKKKNWICSFLLLFKFIPKCYLAL